MLTAPVILFDDDAGRFGPMGDLRAAFEIRTGADTTVQRVARWAGAKLAALWTPERLRDAVAERSSTPVNVMPADDRVLLLNGRLPIPEARFMPRPGEVVLQQGSGELVSALTSRGEAERFLRDGEIPAGATTQRVDAALLTRPWDLFSHLDATIAHDAVAGRPADGREAAPATVVGTAPVSIHASARLWPGVVIDAEHGPVIIQADAIVRPHATLIGPCVVGTGSTINENAVIRSRTIIGPMCKVGGEIAGTIFQGFSNKSHDGFLGDSYVGKWVNLGAGTMNSNLLNTYGEVIVRLADNSALERTGRTFLGAVIGDHAKLAIGTRLMTGTSIGVGAMIATSAPPPATTPAFAWITDAGTRQHRLDKFLATMHAVMERRRLQPGPAYLALLEALHARSAVGE